MSTAPAAIVRPPDASDRESVHNSLTRCGAFSDDEIRVAIEMFDAGVAGDYALLGIDIAGAMRAYACFAKASLTECSWYLYWFCVDPEVQGLGIGRRLETAVVESIREHCGERVVVETSGRPDYARARRFYERAGFVLTGRIPDFYRPGDDCVIYCKVLRGAACN